MEAIAAVLASVIVAATPLLIAALGELVVEKAGVLNLGVEGLMLIGAVFGFAAAFETGSPLIGVCAAMFAAALASMIFALLTQLLMSNQVATGLALTLFGVGVSSLVGRPYVGERIRRIGKLEMPILSDLPFFGRFLFSHDWIVYVSALATVAVAFFVYRSRWGLILRSVGENHDAAHALGFRVIWVRTGAIAFGAAMAGLAGAYLSLAYALHWSEGMTAGRGWIALALVVFSTWKPARLLLGAYLFGFALIAQLNLQGLGISISPQILSMSPYLATILILAAISKDRVKQRLSVPGCLGKGFNPFR